VFAGRGPLGLDSPRLIVQVKSSPTPVDVKVVRELHGVLSTYGAEQALLVAWGGVNKAAKQELRNQFFKVRVWSADELLDALMRTYPVLSEDLRAELPLKQIWSLVEEAE
jgi:restriction system protein